MKIKLKGALGFLATAFLAAGCLVGCSDNKNVSGLVDFDNTTVTMEVGERYTPDLTTVKDWKGNEYDVIVSAKDSKGKDVGVTNGEFNLTDMDGYTVYYRVYADEGVSERKVTVNVEDTTGPELTFLNVRKQRDLGAMAIPTVFVSDNSGEKPAATVSVSYKGTPTTLEPVTMTDSSIKFNESGTYVLTATASDSRGNVGKTEQEIVITGSMGANVWEDFSDENHMETVKNTTYYTSETKAEWLETFEGGEGVARIQPNYGRYYQYAFFVQLGLPKSYEEIALCQWDYINVRAYLSVKGATEVNVGNGDNIVFGKYSTGEWVDIQISRKDFFVKENTYVFPNFVGKETLADYRNAFAKAMTDPVPRPLFSVNVGSTLYNKIELSDVVIYIDDITWGVFDPDITPPVVTVSGAHWTIATNSRFTLPTINVSDERDNLTTYKSRAFYKVEEGGDIEIPIEGGTVAIGGAGEYKLVVKAEDFSGNETVQEFIFTAKESVDYSVFATYDNAQQIGGAAGELEWLESYAGEKGVMKITTTDSVLKLQFPEVPMDKAIEQGWKYIRFRINIDVTEMDWTGENNLYSWNSKLGSYKPNSWVDFYVTIDKLCKNSFFTYQNEYSEAELRSKVASQCVNAQNNFMTVVGYKGGVINVYIDEITWGVEMPEIDYSTFATFDTGTEGVNFDTDRTTGEWLAAYENADGVVKITVDGSEEIRFGRLDSTIMEKAIAGGMDYIRLRMYVDLAESTNSATPTEDNFRSWNSKLGKFTTGAWIDYDIPLDKLAQASYFTFNYTTILTREEIYTKLQSWSSSAQNNIMMLAGQSGVWYLYIDSISWGVYEETEDAVANAFATFNEDISEVTTATNNTTTTYEWVESFEGANGVLKANLPYTGATVAANYLRLGLNSILLAQAATAGMNYITFRLYVSADEITYHETAGTGNAWFRSKNASLGTVKAGEWVDFKLNLADLVNAQGIEGTTLEDIRTEVANDWKGASAMFYLHNAVSTGYTLYIDSISWGV